MGRICRRSRTTTLISTTRSTRPVTGIPAYRARLSPATSPDAEQRVHNVLDGLTQHVLHRGVARNLFWGRYKFLMMYIVRSITITTSFLLHKNLPGLILGGYIYRYTPRRYGPGSATAAVTHGTRDWNPVIVTSTQCQKTTLILHYSDNIGWARKTYKSACCNNFVYGANPF